MCNPKWVVESAFCPSNRRAPSWLGRAWDSKKAIRRIANELGAQILATRTRDLMRFRRGELPTGSEFKDKNVAVGIDGGRVRVRTVVETRRVGGKRKRKKFRVEWREPKVVIVLGDLPTDLVKRFLLWDGLARAIRSEVAVFALVVDARDEAAEAFYRHHGLVAFVSRARQCILPLTKFVMGKG